MSIATRREGAFTDNPQGCINIEVTGSTSIRLEKSAVDGAQKYECEDTKKTNSMHVDVDAHCKKKRRIINSKRVYEIATYNKPFFVYIKFS
jgi:hypothetical protein